MNWIHMTKIIYGLSTIGKYYKKHKEYGVHVIEQDEENVDTDTDSDNY